jgi:transposase
MMVALLLYGYSRGVYASRRLAQACEEPVDFMAVTGLLWAGEGDRAEAGGGSGRLAEGG